MSENYETLRNLINALSFQNNMHICIHDISGITKNEAFSVDTSNEAHTKSFCTGAKSTPRGFNLCIHCKMYANKKAITSKTLFYGYCPYGLFEIVNPVIIEEKVHCIIYVGNLLFDSDEASKRMQHACAITKVSETHMLLKMKEAQPVKVLEDYIKLAGFIDCYIRLLYKSNKFTKNDSKKHWTVSTLENYINKNYNQNISLKNISKLYFINEKYAGRLFKQQMSCTFHEYLNYIRLDHAVTALLKTSENIINIALNCGFQNVTYFNRIFLKKYHVSPMVYRKNHQIYARHESEHFF